VLILKGVKVLCFDTLLQVLILKELQKEKNRKSRRPAREIGGFGNGRVFTQGE
jgi:hypothetical protein